MKRVRIQKHAIGYTLTLGTMLFAAAMASGQSGLPNPSSLSLPKTLMTSAWPLNQPATQYPDENRSLEYNGKPIPIKENFYSTFGPNHVHFDTTIRITVVDTAKNPKAFAPVKMTTNYTSALFRSTHVPIIGCNIEGGASSDSTADRHCIVFDVATGIDHELFNVHVDAAGNYDAAAYVPWDTTKPMRLPKGQTSADAAGLPILPLLLRYSEAMTGDIPHALRGTMNLTRANQNGGAFTDPASHAAGNNWGSPVYEGQRFYLRKDFPTANLDRIALAIVNCLKTYGLVIADNGASGYITAEEDNRWNQDLLRKLGGSMTLRDFVPVNSGKIVDSTGASFK